MSRTGGIVSASILVMILAGAFSGALIGLVLASILTNQIWLAIGAAFGAVLVALTVRRVLLRSVLQLYPPPEVDLLHVVVAALIGGLAGHELAVDLREPPLSPLIGATSGLLASVLMATFAVTTYRTSKTFHH